MAKFDVNEKEFLLSYISFSSKIRPRLVQQLKALLDNSSGLDEKMSWCTLALEQSMLLFETYLSFYVAFKKRKKVDFIETLNKEHDIQEVSFSLLNKSKDEILKELDFDVNLYNLTNEQTEFVNSRIIELSEIWQSQKVVEVFRGVLIPLFNKIKHKMLFYKKDGGYTFVFENVKDEVASKILKKHGVENKPNQNPIAEIQIFVDFSNALEVWLNDIITLRLIELGVTHEEIVAKMNNP